MQQLTIVLVKYTTIVLPCQIHIVYIFALHFTPYPKSGLRGIYTLLASGLDFRDFLLKVNTPQLSLHPQQSKTTVHQRNCAGSAFELSKVRSNIHTQYNTIFKFTCYTSCTTYQREKISRTEIVTIKIPAHTGQCSVYWL